MEFKEKEVGKEFIERTIKILKEDLKNTKYDVTLWINCCIGLLVVPRSHYFDAIPNKKVNVLGKDWGLVTHQIKKWDFFTIQQVIRHIRNGICHAHIETIAENKEIKKLKIKDFNDDNELVFEIELSIDQFKKFTLKVASTILKYEK